MAVFDLYSKRLRRARGQLPDTVTYDNVPSRLRQQVCYIFRDLLNADRWEFMRDALRREYGVAGLVVNASRKTPQLEVEEFLQAVPAVEQVLDAIELGFKIINIDIRQRYEAEQADGAIEELNIRFREHGIGYRFEAEANELVRADSQVLHEDAVRPALRLLHDPRFAGAEEEFLQALDHHRHRRAEDTLVWCLKAFESTLKTICSLRGWDATGRAKELLSTVFGNGLLDPAWQSHFGSLRSLLESGIPTARNNYGGHGQGTELREVPDHLATFVVHETASAVVFFVEAERALA